MIHNHKSTDCRVEPRRRLAAAAVVLTTGLLLSGLLAVTGHAAGGAYDVHWFAADPTVNRAPYLPTYDKLRPGSLVCPTPSGSAGRAADPLANAVAYGPTYLPTNLDAVTSLEAKAMALGQIVPFELEVKVSGSTAPENGVISVTVGFNTHTTSGDNFGFDPAYMVYCAFVDSADAGTIDPGANAKVDSFASILSGSGSSEEIQGTLRISGLDSGDNVIVEIWVVLKSTIPPKSSGNVATRLISAQTVATPPDAISGGNQTVSLGQVGAFFTADADVSVAKTDSADPINLGHQLDYTITVTNNSADTVANGVVVTDTLDSQTTFVSGTWAAGTCTAASGVVTCNVGALSPGQVLQITVVVNVSGAVTNNDPSTNPEAGGAGSTCPSGVDLCNTVSVAALTTDPNTANNSYYQPTNVVAPTAVTLQTFRAISAGTTPAAIPAAALLAGVGVLGLAVRRRGSARRRGGRS